MPPTGGVAGDHGPGGYAVEAVASTTRPNAAVAAVRSWTPRRPRVTLFDARGAARWEVAAAETLEQASKRRLEAWREESFTARGKHARRGGSILERLRPEESQDVLRRLLAAHPELRGEAEELARSRMREVTFETIADEVEAAVGAFALDDLNGPAGRHAWGYVSPTEAAWEILEEAIEPFLSDIKRQIELGLEAEALEICKGVVLGLYRVERRKGGALADWAPDFPVEAAGGAIETWWTRDRTKKTARAGAPRKRLAFPQEFSDRFVPDWRDMIARLLSRKG